MKKILAIAFAAMMSLGTMAPVSYTHLTLPTKPEV